MNAKLKMTIAMITFGTLSIFVKNIGLNSAEIALYRGVIALVVLMVFLLAKKQLGSVFSSRKGLYKLALSGAAMGFNWILLFQAYRYTSVALSTLCYYFAPTLVIIMSWLLFREKLTTRQIVCFVGSTAGLISIVGIGGGDGTNQLLGIACGIGAAVLYSVVVLLNKSMDEEVSGITRTVFQFMAAAVVLTPYVWLTSGFHLHQLDSTGLLNLTIVGAVHTGIMYLLYFSSLATLKGQEAAILSYMDPLVAVLVSIFWFGEATTAVQLLGGMAILGFTLLNEVRLADISSLFKQKSQL